MPDATGLPVVRILGVVMGPRQASLEGGVGKGMEKSQNWQNGTLEKGINSLFLLKGYSWNHAFQV